MWRNKKTTFERQNWLVSCHSCCWQYLLTHWAKMSLPWRSSEMHLHKDREKVSTTAGAQLLASADTHGWLFAAQLCRSHPAQGTQAKALFPPIHGRFSCCNYSYWQFPLQRFQVLLDSLPVNIKSQEKLCDSVWSCCFWFSGHYCCLFYWVWVWHRWAKLRLLCTDLVGKSAEPWM